MSLNLQRDLNGKPILKNITTFNNNALLNQLADSKPAGRDTIYFENLTIGDVVIDNTIPAKLQTTTDISIGIASANKALVLDNNKSVSGINKIYVTQIYINNVLLNPSIFQGGSVAVSTNDAIRPELNNLTLGIASVGKALILNSRGKITGLNKISVEAVETGNKLIINSLNNSLKMNNIEYFDRYYNRDVNLAHTRIFLNAQEIGFSEGIGPQDIIIENCYSNSLEIHVAVFSANYFAYSYNGNSWFAGQSFSTISYVNWFSDLNLFIGVGGNNIYYSSDGINWTSKKVSNFNLYCIEWSKKLDLFVIGGELKILYSNSLLGDWTNANYISDRVRQIVYIDSSNKFIARTDSNVNSIIFSNDGINWIHQHVSASSSSSSITEIFYCKSKNIIILINGFSSSSKIYKVGYYSKDGGLTLRPINSTNDYTYSRFKKIKYIPDYGFFIGMPDAVSRTCYISYSLDGINWKPINISTGIGSSPIKSITFDRKSGNIFLRSGRNDVNYSQNFKLLLSPLYNTIKNYNVSSNPNILSLNSDDNKLLNIGSQTGKLISFANSLGQTRTIDLINGELILKANSINLTMDTLKLNNNIIFMNNLFQLNKQILNNYYFLNTFNSDLRKNKKCLIKSDINNNLTIQGYLKLNSNGLIINGSSFSITNNIEEFKNNTIGLANANKFLIAKYGGEINGINKFTANSVKLDNYIISGGNTNNNKLIDLSNKHMIDINKKNNRNPFGSTLYAPASGITITQSLLGAGTTSDNIFYMRDFGVIMVVRNNSEIWINNINNDLWTAVANNPSILALGQNNTINKVVYIKELNTVYMLTSTGIFMSKDLFAWKRCNLYDDINSNVFAITYSPQLDVLLILTNANTQMSKNGVDFRVISDMRYTDRLNLILWVESWGMFIGATNSGSSGSRKQYVYSLDGQTWNIDENQEETLIKSATVPTEIVYSPKLDMAITTTGSTMRYTYDGKFWYNLNTPASSTNGQISWIQELEIFILSSNSTSVALLYYSYDGINWLALRSPASIPSATFSSFNRNWTYIHKEEILISSSTGGQNGVAVIQSNFLKNYFLTPTKTITESNDILSIDIINNRVGLGVSSPQFSLHLGEDLAFKPTSSVWTTSSDERLKEDIEDANLDMCYNNIKNIPLKKFKWKDEIYKGKVNHSNQIGWIAQDVEKYINKAVERKNMFNIEDCRTLNNDQIIANMYGAVKKLINIDEELENYFV